MFLLTLTTKSWSEKCKLLDKNFALCLYSGISISQYWDTGMSKGLDKNVFISLNLLFKFHKLWERAIVIKSGGSICQSCENSCPHFSTQTSWSWFSSHFRPTLIMWLRSMLWLFPLKNYQGEIKTSSGLQSQWWKQTRSVSSFRWI